MAGTASAMSSFFSLIVYRFYVRDADDVGGKCSRHLCIDSSVAVAVLVSISQKKEIFHQNESIGKMKYGLNID